jgi:hypothetical protein
VYATNLQVRALFEAAIYLEWILQADGANKAAHYYVHNLRRQRRWALRIMAGTPEGTDFRQIMPDIASLSTKEVQQQAADHLSEIDRVLGQQVFATINAAFEACRTKRNDRPWHYPLGIKTLAGMADKVGKSALYAVLYSSGSEAAHGSNYSQHIKIGKGRVTWEPIRYLAGLETLFRFSVVLALGTYRLVLSEFRSGELPAFNRKYKESWQQGFMNIPKVTYTITETNI